MSALLFVTIVTLNMDTVVMDNHSLLIYAGWSTCSSRSVLIASTFMIFVAVFIWFYSSGHFHSLVLYYVYSPFSKGVPPCPSTFVGRTNEVQELMQLMDRTSKIIHIVGPPGFGKSTLAICVGNLLISKRIVVRYIDMAEVTHQNVQQVIAEKILYQESTHSDMTNVTFDHLLSWADWRFWQNLIIFDNCDEPLNHQRDLLNEAIEKLVKQSDNIKVLVTSREEPLFVEKSQALKVDSLNIDETCKLLDHKSPDLLNMTEKIAIANLTGSVPLALQIVGSLLNKRLKPPTPSVIIEELRRQPIPTLSPTDLNRKMRINASISVSYNYLEPKLRKIARYLADFPGSFTKSIAAGVLRSISSNVIEVTEEYIETCLSSLVTRSLLEYNTHSERYHFHRLLKEFFRDVQLDSHRSERGRFVLAFQLHISGMLTRLTETFLESPKKALSMLDKERHNVQYLIEITNRPYNCSHIAYSAAVASIHVATYSKFLSCRFSTEELIEPVSSIVFVMRSKVLRAQEEKDILWYCKMYVHFIIRHAQFLSELKGSEVAAKWFKTHVRDIETTSERIVDPGLQREMATVYTKFYVNLITYEEYLDEERVRVYNTRILNKTIQLQPTADSIGFVRVCGNTINCPYWEIANAYYHIKEYKKSIQFLEKVLKSETLGLNVQVTLSVYLVNSYEYIGDNEKAMDAFERTIIHFYTHVLNSPSTLVIRYYRDYVRKLRQYGETQKALELERKELHELSETGAKGGMMQAVRAHDFARQLYDQYNDTEAIAMATLALRIMEQETWSDAYYMKLTLKILIGKAQHRSGNSSESLPVFMEVADWILEQEATNIYESEYSDACWHLIFHTKYMYECYLRKFGSVGTQIINIGIVCGYYLLVPPLDLHVHEKHSKEETINHFEELMGVSRIKDILLRADSGDSALSTTFHYSDSTILEEEGTVNSDSAFVWFFKFASKFALRFTTIRAGINVILIVIKLWIFAAFLFCLYRCLICCGCGCCFCCCHLISSCITTLAYCLSVMYTYIVIKYFDH